MQMTSRRQNLSTVLPTVWMQIQNRWKVGRRQTTHTELLQSWLAQGCRGSHLMNTRLAADRKRPTSKASLTAVVLRDQSQVWIHSGLFVTGSSQKAANIEGVSDSSRVKRPKSGMDPLWFVRHWFVPERSHLNSRPRVV